MKLRGKFLKFKEKLQFQRVFPEIFGLLKPEVIEQINTRCAFRNTASCHKQHALYRIALA